MPLSQLITITVVAVSTFITPLPSDVPLYGKFVNYGGQQLVEANAAFHGYDLSPYWNRCGAAAMSPVDLGRIFYVMPTEGPAAGQVIGPCVFIDSSQRTSGHFTYSVYTLGETVEAGGNLRDALGLEYGLWGYVWVGLCPPDDWSELDLTTEIYRPPLVIDEPPYEADPRYYPYPPQEMPIDCSVERPVPFSKSPPGNIKARKGSQSHQEPPESHLAAWEPYYSFLAR